MSVEDKLDQILTNQATILGNQATTLTAINAITPGGSQAITDALTKIEGQVTAIQSTIGTEAAPAPAAAPAVAPAA